ncbi:MAG: T9SS type A sorting domain-containing protein [Lacibacter sp.]
MKQIFTLIAFSLPFFLHAQVVCGTANEGGVLTLTAPPGNIITSIEFASYGTPNGSCGAFTIGGCHATNSVSICSSTFVGFNSASINATNAVFGDPCNGTVKRLYIQATYATTLPVTLVSFIAKPTEQNTVKLFWVSAEEINTSHFIIERSTDAVTFEVAGTVKAGGSGGYSFADNLLNSTASVYYRLKIVDYDGKIQYSDVIRMNTGKEKLQLLLFPNPSTKVITIISNKDQDAFIANYTGQVVQSIKLKNGAQAVNVSLLQPGVYFIKTKEEIIRFIKN